MAPEFFYPLLGFGFAAFFGVLGTVRWYLGNRLKMQAQAQSPMAPADEGRVHALEGRVAELEERLDFAERLLARGTDAPQGR